MAASEIRGPVDESERGAPPGARVVVDLDALARNYARLRAASGATECAAVVKANAYGLGVEAVARRLRAESCTEFFVATLTEALELRRILPDATIHVFEGPSPGAVDTFVAAQLTPVLNTLAQIDLWARAARPATLHVDTGMTRLGLGEADVRALAREPARLARIEVETVMTHLACADEPGHELNSLQLERFDALRALLPRARTSIGNSAGALLGGRHAGDMIRPGIGLYGGHPFVAGDNPVELVATVSARVVQVNEVADARTVGYGATHAVEPGARIAAVAFGYADGYPRCLGNRGFAAVAGMRVPVVGRVSMDLIGVDVSGLPGAAVAAGTEIELIGPNVPLDELARAADTIGYELLVRLGPRVRREYLGAVDV